MPWIPLGDKQFCNVHDPKGETPFGRLGQCVECLTSPIRVSDPIGIATDDQPEESPAGCLTVTENERSIAALAMFSDGKARLLCEPGDEQNYPIACKMFDIAIKAYRTAGEYARARERKNYVNRLERTVKRLRGGRN